MQPFFPVGAPRHDPTRPVRRALLLATALLVGLCLPSATRGEHGGREIGSLLACDRPVEPPRCTSVGNDFLHYVAFDASLSDGLASSLRDSMAEDYGPTRLHLIEQDVVTDATDVIAFSGDFGENGAAGWVYCPAGAPQGINDQGDRWCRQQEMFFNLNPRYGLFFDDDASRDHVTCHELGHTLGLRHWGNPPETEGEFGATCMNSNTPNGPTGLHPIDVEHIDAYPYRRVPTPADVHVVQAPGGERSLAGGAVQATGTDDPRTLTDLLASSDAVVRGRVLAVEPGRTFGPASRPLAYASVSVEVGELLTGSLPPEHRDIVVIEVPLFEGREAIDALRGATVGSERIVFLRNKGASALAAGMDADAVAADAGYYRLAAFGAELTLSEKLAWAAGDVVAPLRDLAGLPASTVIRALRAAPGR